jgi:Uma2 family endonuclease
MDAVAIRHRRYDVDTYYALGESGVIGPEDRTELIEGEIIPMAPIGIDHGACVVYLNDYLVKRLGGRALVSVQGPLRLDQWSEPVPDFILLPHDDRFRRRHPTPADALLVIEVSDTTIRRDRSRKLPLYARFGIPEVWIVDLRRARIEVYREPRDGAYASKSVLSRGASLSPAVFPDVVLTVDEIVGPERSSRR